jgi:Tol biopolymer transport system component
VALAVVGVGAVRAPDSALGRWVRDVLGTGEPAARPALGHIPGGGRLLVTGAGDAWVVAGDGARRRLGAFSGAAWSPHGLFVAAWRGGQLTAVDPGGRVRWSLSRPSPIGAARWAPVDGFRIAYLAGGRLRIVNGDGTGDRDLAPARADVAPAWRPDNTHVLAYSDPAGRVTVVAVDNGRRLWRSRPVGRLVQLAWSPRGDRLLGVTRGGLVLFDGTGRRIASRRAPAGWTVSASAWSPDGRSIALVRHDGAAPRSELLVARAGPRLRERVLFTGPGRFGAPAWSPGGGRLLVPWPDADQWLFLRPHGGSVDAVADIARQFAPGRARAAFPTAVEWCCAAPAPAPNRP